MKLLRPAPFNVYAFQRRALPVLIGWAAGSMIAGAIWRRQGPPFWRGLGGQFLAWGAIDGLIALAGLGWAVRSEKRLADGQISADDLSNAARTFERVLWINAGLDVGYVLGGASLLARSPERPDRRGMGAGITVQGLYLLIWDVTLALLVRRQRQS